MPRVSDCKRDLIPTCDRKVQFWSNQYNTFGMVPGPAPIGTCPGATLKEGGCWHVSRGKKLPECYACKITHCYGGVMRILKHNTRALARKTQPDMESLLTAEFASFRQTELSHAKRTGTKACLVYRLHWSGDLFSERYAKALAKVVRKNSDILFWNYTRSFKWISYFKNVPNLITYLSLDPVNKQEGMRVYKRWKTAIPNLRIAYMSKINDFQELKLISCPVDAGKLELTGGCARCGVCWKRNKHAWFAA